MNDGMITCYWCETSIDVDVYTAWELGWHDEEDTEIDGRFWVCPKCEMDFEEFNFEEEEF